MYLARMISKCINCGTNKFYESGCYLKCKKCNTIIEDKNGYGY